MDNASTDDELLTISQAARLKGVSRTALYAAIEQGRLPRLQSLGRLVVRRGELFNLPIMPGHPQGKPVSEDVRQRISRGQKKRWKELKAQADQSDSS